MTALSNKAIPLCSVDEIADCTAKGFEIGGESIFALKFDNEFRVYRNSCPHLGVELNWLEDQFFDLDGALIQCATHGALFDPLTGCCISGPCRGQSLERMSSEIANGQLYLNPSSSSES